MAVVGYRVHRGLTSNFVPDATNLVATTSSTSVTDSPSAGRYFYKVVAEDAVPNSSAPSASLSVVVPDLEAPSQPTSVAATMSAPGAVTVTWTGSTDNVAVAGYRVYRGTTAGFSATSASLVGTVGPTLDLR